MLHILGCDQNISKTCLILQTVAELGVVIFTALDFGLKEDEERQLSPALENVIDLMTSAGEKSMHGLPEAKPQFTELLKRSVNRFLVHFCHISWNFKAKV